MAPPYPQFTCTGEVMRDGQRSLAFESRVRGRVAEVLVPIPDSLPDADWLLFGDAIYDRVGEGFATLAAR